MTQKTANIIYRTGAILQLLFGALFLLGELDIFRLPLPGLLMCLAFVVDIFLDPIKMD